MKYFWLCSIIILAFGSCKAQRPNAGKINTYGSGAIGENAYAGATRFGVLVKPPAAVKGNALNFKVAVARKLGISCLRDAITLDNPKDKPIFNNGFQLVLNVNNSSLANKAQSPFVTDTAAYKSRLQYQLSLMRQKPVLLVIENEENNLRFHGGPAQDYLNQLRAATTVAHNNHVAVTNGGITYPAIMYLLYLDYLAQGKKLEAAALQQRTSVPFTAKWLTSRKDFLQELIAGYATLDIDYVNFHWYGKNGDTRSLTEIVNYLQRVTGKPAISNEIGAQDASAETVKAIVKTCRQLNMPYAIWYSGDGEKNTDEQAVALHNTDGTLREAGKAFVQALTNENH